MTDKEWIENLPSASNKELMESLDYFGYDNYYRTCREPLVAEITKRLTENEQLKMQIEKMKCCHNCKHYDIDANYKAFCLNKKANIENPVICKCKNWQFAYDV